MNARPAIALLATGCIGACALVFALRGQSTECMAFVMLIVPSPLQLMGREEAATIATKENPPK